MAEGERSFLGLTHNPFTQGDEGFFERGNRKTHLEQLRHPSQWTRRVLLVTGPDSVGKSVLYRQFSATLDPRAKAARINGAFINTSREVLMSIVQGFGIAAPADSNKQLLCDMIESHCADYQAQDRVCLVMIDDAENLEPRAMDDLLGLVESSALRTVFFGEVRLVPMVERVATRLDLEWHEIRLTGFDEAAAREYLEWRFQQAKYRGRLPFTDQQVKEIVQRSQGLPGKINQMANVALAKLEIGDSDEESKRFPALHRAVVILLVVVIGFGYLLWQQRENAARDARALASRGGVVQEVSAPLPAESAAPETQTTDPTVESAAADRSALADTSAPADRSAPAPTNVGNADHEPLQASVTPRTETNASDTPGDGAAGTAEVIAVPAEDSTVSGSDPEVSAVRASSLQPIETQPVAVAQVRTLPKSRARDAAWVMRQPATAFTLQMLTVSSEAGAVSFVNARRDPERFALYRVQRNGQVFFVVVYGIYDSREEAQNVAASLPDSFRNITPWARPLSQIQDAIRTALQQ